jgi:hypothetical protein
MKNVVICSNCGKENPFYKHTCINCKGYLRDRIYNLDLWQLTGALIENPVKAFIRIIQSEHKNFIILITVLFSLRAFIDSRYLSVLVSGESPLRIGLIPELLISAGAGFLVIWIFTIILFFLNKINGLKTRIRDNNAVLIYSLLPFSFALIILFPVELIIFGQYLFSNNPSPFVLKPGVAYTLLAFEGLLILWGIFLSVSGIYALSRNISYSLIVGLIFNIYMFGFIFLLSIILFI